TAGARLASKRPLRTAARAAASSGRRTGPRSGLLCGTGEDDPGHHRRRDQTQAGPCPQRTDEIPLSSCAARALTFRTCARPGLDGLVSGGALAERGPASSCRRRSGGAGNRSRAERADRKSTGLNSSHQIISYAVFCLKKIIEKK